MTPPIKKKARLKAFTMWSFFYFDESIVDALNDYRVENTFRKAKAYAVGEYRYKHTMVKITVTPVNRRSR